MVMLCHTMPQPVVASHVRPKMWLALRRVAIAPTHRPLLRSLAATSCPHSQHTLARVQIGKHTPVASTIAMVSSTGGDINSSRPLLILGIESSCDDTGAAVVTSSGTVLGETLATQADIHAQWGGVVPSLAKEAHQAAIDRVVDEALQQAQLTADQLDAVAVTIGPGLSLCLDVGVRKARAVCR